jgi:hypothetical protein
MGSNNLKYWELSSGGDTGNIFIDATISTAVVTGLQAGKINVLSGTVFADLKAWDVSTATAIDFRIDNGLSGVTCAVSEIWPGHGRYFTTIQISTGQISYVLKRDN